MPRPRLDSPQRIGTAITAIAVAALAACGALHTEGDGGPPTSVSVHAIAASGATPVAIAGGPSAIHASDAAEAGAPGADVDLDATSPAPIATDAAVTASLEGMLVVPGGRFAMGSDDGGEPDERPTHEVTVARFWLDTTEVTNAAYDACVAAKACRPHDPSNAAAHHLDDKTFRGPRQPVSGVSWDDAAGYCAHLGKRLPTEAEWERAARGDDGRRYPWGSEPPDAERATFATNVTSDVGTHPKGAGPYGHLDLTGNVWEWMADEYDPYAYRRPSAPSGRPGTCPEILDALAEIRRTNQRGFTGSNPIPTECEHVLRGGGFNYPGRGLRASNRVHHPGRFRLVMSGFRCARDG